MIQLSRHLFSVEEYDRMAESGCFAPEARVELIEGQVINMSPIGNKHAACVDRLARFFLKFFGDQLHVRIQGPIELNKYSKPQPDVAVLKPRDDCYEDHTPRPQEILLIVEVSDSTLEYDQEIKLPLYATANIPEVWIVNLQQKSIEIYTQPRDGKYHDRSIIKHGEPLSSKTIVDLNLKAEDILG